MMLTGIAAVDALMPLAAECHFTKSGVRILSWNKLLKKTNKKSHALQTLAC